MLGDPSRHHGPRTIIAVVVAQIPPELHAIGGSRRQLLAQIRHKRVERTGRLAATRTLGKVISDQKAPDSLPAHVQVLRNCPDA